MSLFMQGKPHLSKATTTQDLANFVFVFDFVDLLKSFEFFETEVPLEGKLLTLALMLVAAVLR